jgi:hypothetical protein
MKKLIFAVLLTLAIGGGVGATFFYAPPAHADCGSNHTS